MLATIHINLLYGDNDHHKTEAIFKSAARAISGALEITGGYIPSTKGTI
jgi:imidazoleglycerol-phosphate dehydratase